MTEKTLDEQIAEDMAAVEQEVEAPAEEVAEEEGELVVSIGEQAAEEEVASPGTPQWVKDLRKDYRRLGKEKARLEQELQKLQAPKTVDELGPMPGMDDEDVDYDADKYKTKLAKWYEKKAAIEERTRAAQAAEATERDAWNAKLAAHAAKGKELGVADYEEAEEEVFAALDQTQKGIIINYSDNSALLTLALQRNPAKLQFLAGLKDPGTFIREMTKLEGQMKTSKRRPATQPESRIEPSSGGKPTTSQGGLKRLEEEAERTGDRSKVIAYKRSLRSATN